MSPDSGDALLNCVDSIHGLMLVCITLEELDTEFKDLYSLMKDELSRDFCSLQKVAEECC